MKIFKLLLFFIVSVLLITGMLSLLLSTSQKVERTVTIQAPASVIYHELSRLENFHRFSVWSQNDSTVRYTPQGTDGTVGAATLWSGDPEISGDGKIEITALEANRSVAHKLSFTRPRKGTATSLFTLRENGGLTSVTWQFRLATPRPWNIFNLFYSLDKEMGADFETGLNLLKKAIETRAGTIAASAVEIRDMDFPATTFLQVRQQVGWTDMGRFYAQHLPLVYQEALKAQASPGTPTGLYYRWDEQNQRADMSAAVPVKSGTEMRTPLFSTENIPASKAVYVNYYGAYDKLPGIYSQVRALLAEKKLKQKYPIIEQYITDPAKEKDTARWLTKIVFLVE